jgi:alkylation response protein AidB-like acyl-CoA dehydrogenase
MPGDLMSLTFSAEQVAFREAVRSFLAGKSPEDEVRRLMATEQGYDPVVWAQLNDQLAVAGLAVPEEYGGSGYTFRELAIVLEEAGRSLLCAPLLSSVLASAAVIASADEPAARELLPPVARGATLATVAFTHAEQHWNQQGTTVSARTAADGRSWALSGTAGYVIDGHTADLIIVPAGTPAGLSLFAVRADAPGLARSVLPALDQTRKLARLEFTGAPGRLIGADGAAAGPVGQVQLVAAAALACEQAGVAEAAKEMAVQYAKERIQFGQPIGQFQAIKHKCADLHVAAESAKSAAYAAAAAIAESPADLAEIVAVAASFCSEACLLAGHENIQIHGGIGFTWEHPAQLYYKRAKSSEFLFGDVTYHRELLAAEIGL